MLFPIFASKSQGFQIAFWSDCHWLSRQPVPVLHTKGTRSPLPTRVIKLQGLICCCSLFQAGKLLLPAKFVMLLCHFCKASFLLSKATCGSIESCASSDNFLINKLHQENHLLNTSTWHKVCLKKTKALVMRATRNEKQWTDKHRGLDDLKAAAMWEVCIRLL